MESTLNKENIDFDKFNTVSEYWYYCMATIEEFKTPNVTISDDPWSRQIKAFMQFWQNSEVDHAIEAALAAEKMDEGRELHIAKYLLGMVAIKQDDFDSAFSYFSKVVAATPEQPLAHYYLSVCELRRKGYKKAFEHLLISHSLDPNIGPVNANLALLYGILRNYQASSLHAMAAISAGVEVGNRLVSLVKFQADFFHRGDADDSFYPFNLSFFDNSSEQEAREILRDLVKSEIVYQSDFDEDALTVFISSDSVYLNEHVFSQIASIQGVKTTKFNFHIHIVNPASTDVENVARLLKDEGMGLRVSIEYSEEKTKLYYSTIRFCRLFQYMNDFKGGVLSVDADMLFRKCPATFDVTHPVTLLHLKGEFIWQEVCGQVLYIKPCPESMAFLANVSAAISKHLLSKEYPGRWFLDQICLFNAHYLAGEGQVACFEPLDKYSDMENREDGYIWAITSGYQNGNAFLNYKNQLTELVNLKIGRTFNVVTNTNSGRMIVNVNDQSVGRSLQMSGSWRQHEVDLALHLLKAGDTVIDAGANYGAFTVPVANYLGSEGTVYAFEQHGLVFQALCGSLALNSIANVKPYHAALGDKPSIVNVPRLNFNEENNFGGVTLMEQEMQTEEVSCLTIDSLNLGSLTMLKVDVEGMTLSILQGAAETIAKLNPILYLKNQATDKCYSELISYCDSLGYELFWHGPKTDRMILGLHSTGSWPEINLERVKLT